MVLRQGLKPCAFFLLPQRIFQINPPVNQLKEVVAVKKSEVLGIEQHGHRWLKNKTDELNEKHIK